jgi:hypothetical protein
MHACARTTTLCTTSDLNQIVRSVKPVIKAATLDRTHWTGAQFAHAVLLLLNSKHNAFSKRHMEVQLGRHVAHDVSKQQLRGQAVVAALVKAERLALRRYSDWSVVIPHTTYVIDDITSYDIATAPSPVELLCMKSIQPQLECTLQAWEQNKQVCSVSHTSSLWRPFAICCIRTATTETNSVAALLRQD